jgi:hypothetical protein
MGKRITDRLKLVLPVRIWGMDTTGKPFHQMAHTLNVNKSGARLGGVRVIVGTDEIIGVQYKHKKARFKVVWLGKPGTKSQEQLGVTRIAGEPEIWPVELPTLEIRDQYEAPTPPPASIRKKEADKRELKRYACSGGIEVRVRHSQRTGVWGSLTEISLGGCYTQMTSPYAKDSAVDFVIRVGTVEIKGHGIIRASVNGAGMGVDFVGLPDTDRERLEYLIEKYSRGEMTEQEPAFSGDEVSKRLQAATTELREIEDLIKAANVDSVVLREFRSALGHVRHTAWALQQWLELQAKHNDPFPVIAYLNNERIRLATHLCRNLTNDMDALQLKFERREVEGLLSSVEDLFQRLAGFNFSIEEPVQMAAAAAAGAETYLEPIEEPTVETLYGIRVEGAANADQPAPESEVAEAIPPASERDTSRRRSGTD